MTILLIEYRVDDFAAWKAVFDQDPMERGTHGVTRHFLYQNPHNRNHLLVSLEFGAHEEAKTFLEALLPVWEMSGAVQSWILEETETKAY